MLKVSKILTSNRIYGWLLPDGSYHPVSFAGHEDWALGNHSRLNITKESLETESVYDIAFKNGWLRLTAHGASTDTWTDAKLHRLQEFLMTQSIATSNFGYQLDYHALRNGRRSWETYDTTVQDLLVANKISDLARSRVASYGKYTLTASRVLTADDSSQNPDGSFKTKDAESMDPKQAEFFKE